jgi:hypothetical protein
MTTQSILTPLPTFTGTDGQPLPDGSVYIGQANLDPRSYPVSVYYDAAKTIPATQPLKTTAGYICRNGSPTNIWLDDGLHSMLALDSKGRQVFYAPAWTGSKDTTIRDVTVNRFSGTGASATYTLTATPSNANALNVYVNGVYQQKNSYVLSGANLTITAASGVLNVEAVISSLDDFSAVSGTLAGYVSSASTSATAAATSRAQMLYIIQGSFDPGSPPTHRDDGSAVQNGDYAFFTDNLFRRYNGATWVASDINTANLAASGGAASVGTSDSTTVEDRLKAINLADYTALRAYAGAAKSVYVTGYLVSANPSGVAGLFTGDDSDTTSADNGGTIIVASNGKRWKRVIADGKVQSAWFGALFDWNGTTGTDNYSALQAGINFCQSSNSYGGYELVLPNGQGKISASLSLSKEFIAISGAGMWQSQIIFNGVAGGGIVSAAQSYLRPMLRNFALVGDSSSGRAIDFSAVTSQVYGGELKNLYLQAGGNAFHSVGASASNFFSMNVDGVFAYSYNGHCFLAGCGPAVSWRNCYALTAGTSKAGYRLAGVISMYSCNGVNTADFWGVFGCDTAASDGFQTDFPFTDFPNVEMIGCNVENFASGAGAATASGILLHNSYRNFVMEGGKIDRSGLSTGYHSIIRARRAPNSAGNPIALNPGSFFIGSGTPSGAYLYSDVFNTYFLDKGGALAVAGVTTWKDNTSTYTIPKPKFVHDTSGETSAYWYGIQSQRLSVNMMRFETATLAVNSSTRRSSTTMPPPTGSS